jgi:hypothetical protein
MDNRESEDLTTPWLQQTRQISHFSKSKKFDDTENIPYIWHPHRNHTTEDCQIFIDRYMRKKGDNKEVDQKKEEKDQGDKGFQNQKAQYL